MSATVVSVDERLPNQQLDDSKEGVNIVREFQVVLSAADAAGSDIALNASGIPLRGDRWPNVVAGRITPYVISRRARLLDERSNLVWLVEVNYSNIPDATGLGSAQSNKPPVPPWEEDARYSYDFIEYSRVLEYDYSVPKNLVVNSAGDRFDPMPESPYSNRKVTIFRTTRDFAPNIAETIQDTCNDSPITIAGEIIATARARLLRWTADTDVYRDPVTEVETKIFNETIEIEIAKYTEDQGENLPRGFLLPVVDAGYHYRDGSGNKTRFTDDFENPLETPGFLDGEGGALVGDPSTDFTLVNILHFRQFPLASWNALAEI